METGVNVVFYWILLSAIILRKLNRETGNILNWILATCWTCLSYNVWTRLAQLEKLKDKYKRLRDECSLYEYALTVYEEPKTTVLESAAHTFVYSQGFLLTEIRSIVVFGVMGLLYYSYNYILERFSETPVFQILTTILRILCTHLVDILIASWLLWIAFSIAYA